MSLGLAYESFRQAVASGNLSDSDPKYCACHGGGWILSDFDTWHECPAHRGMPHPEDVDDYFYHNPNATIEEAYYQLTIDQQHMDHVITWWCNQSIPEDPDYDDGYWDDLPF